MTTLTIENHLAAGHLETALRADVLNGLTATPKRLKPAWFYDARGSELFEEITRLPEYYPTRAEREILTDHAGEIAALTGAQTLVELGSGSSDKTRLLLAAMRSAGTLRRYVPVDVSESALVGAAHALRADHPGLAVHAVVADFGVHLGVLPRGGRRLVAFLGSTIGNLVPEERAAFLHDLYGTLSPGDALLLGTDLVKDPAVLVAAYDDAAGVTARFNANVLSVLNRELGADFDPAAFAHHALWDPEREWIEMRLRSLRQQSVKLPEVDLVVGFSEGEELRTEISAKFRPEGVRAELAAGGFDQQRWWTDRAGRFGLSLSFRR
ncbi:histidine N-alpha-methyltransferase [Planotetraspora thailandica]|uniref:Histidine N-alpha-methyltransferase n=1 Tax=Planotetraspora thailandica TaxID=487172 RepID=A0A8J3XXL6_9ACTN|nr:L-histidine N(alpha)-methyltransferase [Planotetraspora thailandica]GII56794.1 histidine N-alpha-methyltransferase [Planotetraspora thailandica]